MHHIQHMKNSINENFFFLTVKMIVIILLFGILIIQSVHLAVEWYNRFKQNHSYRRPINRFHRNNIAINRRDNSAQRLRRRFIDDEIVN